MPFAVVSLERMNSFKSAKLKTFLLFIIIALSTHRNRCSNSASFVISALSDVLFMIKPCISGVYFLSGEMVLFAVVSKVL
jgi:hypothetical protein